MSALASVSVCLVAAYTMTTPPDRCNLAERSAFGVVKAGPDASDQSGQAEGPKAEASVSPLPTPSSTDWDAVASCESSGDWGIVNPPYFGGLQFTASTWEAYGGAQYASSANLASEAEQIAVAERVAFTGYGSTPPQGLAAWPGCGANA